MLACPESGQLGADVLPHQSGLLVLKDVAMIHERVVARRRLIESDEKLHFILNKNHVFPAVSGGGGGAPAIDKMRNNAPWI